MRNETKTNKIEIKGRALEEARGEDAKEWREGGMLMNGGRVEC